MIKGKLIYRKLRRRPMGWQVWLEGTSEYSGAYFTTKELAMKFALVLKNSLGDKAK